MAPFDLFYQPDPEYMAIYDPTITTLNSYQGGPFQQALSGVTVLNNDWYEGKAYQTYGFEYSPGATGYVEWQVADEPVWKVDARSLRPNGNIGQRVIPKEPMSIIFNVGMGTSFAYIDFVEIASTS